jgi:hypothetical protein
MGRCLPRSSTGSSIRGRRRWSTLFERQWDEASAFWREVAPFTQLRGIRAHSLRVASVGACLQCSDGAPSSRCRRSYPRGQHGSFSPPQGHCSRRPAGLPWPVSSISAHSQTGTPSSPRYPRSAMTMSLASENEDLPQGAGPRCRRCSQATLAPVGCEDRWTTYDQGGPPSGPAGRRAVCSGGA